MKYLIVNADDFGASPGINRGVLEAHRHGILTSASLMVDSDGSAEAAAIAREAPQLSVGLHAVLPEHTGTDADPRCAAELRRQFDRFRELVGRPPTHLDSHHNVHRDGRRTASFVAFARDVDLPLREHSPVRYFSRFYAQWAGETHPEQVSEDSLIHMLNNQIGEGITELSCHPGYADERPWSGYAAERELELRTLCAPRIPAALEAAGIALVSYHDLARLATR